MKMLKRINKRVWIVLAALLVIEVLFDPIRPLINYSENAQARFGLPIARARWDRLNIDSYSFEISSTLGTLCIPSAKVEVRDGKVFQVFRKDDLITMKISETPLPPEKWANFRSSDQFFCNYANFTMPQIFDMLEKSTRGIADISFDRKYGFVSGVRWGSAGGLGLLNTRIWDCCHGFSIANFQVLDDGS